MKKLNLVFILLLVITASSCKREYDQPPVPTIPEGNVITIADLKAMYSTSAVEITEDYSIYATATTDESSGNFYKEVYVQDATGAIQLRLTNSGGIYQGDSVRIYLNGTTLDNYNGMMQLDNVDTDNNIIKQATGKTVAPLVKTIDQLTAADQAMLIQLEDVEFAATSLGATWANAATQSSVNHDLVDCSGINTVLVRTSGYANFADDLIPELNGTFIGILGVYNTDLQLYVREPSDLNFVNPRCTGGGSVICNPVNGLNEDFNAQVINNPLDADCWNTESTDGTLRWACKDDAGNKYAEASILGTSTSTNEMWVVSPEIIYSGSDALTFQTTHAGYNHDGLTVWVSTDYNGSNAATATWTQLTATFAGSGDASGTWVNSGTIDLTGLGLSGNYVIGFKYNASGVGGQTTTYKLDNVIVTQ